VRPIRLIATALAVLAACGTAPRAASAVGVGMSDGRPGLFDSEHLRDLDFQYVRLVLPWDAARRDGTWNAWLARASTQGWPVLIAPTAAGPAPSATDYEAALRDLLARYPAIESVEGWNEPNHGSQPTAGKPALAAAYFEAARRACTSQCTAVAGNLLDAGSMGTYLAAYRAALTTDPAVWGVHNYYDATYFQSRGVDQVAAIAQGEVWITETGGLVSFSPNGPGTGLPADEHRAADGLRWLFTLTSQNPRVSRMYLYGMWQQPWNAFDSALVRVDNTEREGMAVVRAYVGARKSSPSGPTAAQAVDNGTSVVGTGVAAAGPGAAGPSDPTIAAAHTAAPRTAAASNPTATGSAPSSVFRLVGKRITVNRRTGRATITIRCVLADCAGRVTVKAGGWRYARGVQLAAGRTRALRVRLSRRATSTLGGKPSRRATASLCITSSCTAIPLVAR
jgi:Glycosyl hydrolase catalytic core